MPNWSSDTLDEQLAKEPRRLAEINLALVYSGKSVREVREQYGYPEVGDGSIAWESDNDQGVRWDRVFDRHAAKVRLQHQQARERAIDECARARMLLDSLSGQGWSAGLVSKVSEMLLGRVLSGEMTFDEFRQATMSMNAASRAILAVQENDRRNEDHAAKMTAVKKGVEVIAASSPERKVDPKEVADLIDRVMRGEDIRG